MESSECTGYDMRKDWKIVNIECNGVKVRCVKSATQREVWICMSDLDRLLCPGEGNVSRYVLRRNGDGGGKRPFQRFCKNCVSIYQSLVKQLDQKDLPLCKIQTTQKELSAYDVFINEDILHKAVDYEKARTTHSKAHDFNAYTFIDAIKFSSV